MPIAIVLLGPPGSGKGTIVSEFNTRGYVPIVMGDVVREKVKQNQALSHVNNGFLADDDSIAELFLDAISTPRLHKKDVILDGCVRTTNQVKMVIDGLPEYKLAFFLLDCKIATSLARIARRRDEHRIAGLEERTDDKDIIAVQTRLGIFWDSIPEIIFEIERHKGLEVHTISVERSVGRVIFSIDRLMSKIVR
jgi:adenylate kinase family enzyme